MKKILSYLSLTLYYMSSMVMGSTESNSDSDSEEETTPEQKWHSLQPYHKGDMKTYINNIAENVEVLHHYVYDILKVCLEEREEFEDLLQKMENQQKPLQQNKLKKDIEKLRGSVTDCKKDIRESKKQFNLSSALKAGAVCVWAGVTYFKQPQKDGEDLKKDIPTD